VFNNPSPFIPLPLLRGEGRNSREGAKPPSYSYSPFPYKGKGVRGIGC